MSDSVTKRLFDNVFKDNIKGTPQSLRQAIKNGIEDGAQRGLTFEDTVKITESHVIDFLAQRFSVAMMESKQGSHIEALWKRIKE